MAKKDEQCINCTVHDCKYCDTECDCCNLKEIKVCNCSNDENKEATMCDSYKKKN